MRRNRKCIDEILSLLDYLKVNDIPCEITLNYQDDGSNPTEKMGCLNIDLNKIPVDIINSNKHYYLSVQIFEDEFILESHRLFSVYPYVTYFGQLMNERYWEDMTNHQRKTKLKDILSDPNPPTQVPV